MAGLARPAILASLVAVVVAWVATVPAAGLLLPSPQRAATAQDDRRREVTLAVTEAGFEPARIDARLNDIVAITLTVGETPHGLGIDAYRLAKRAGPGQSIHFEFRADTIGTFPFYCSLTGADGRAHDERGELVVRR